MYETKLNQIFLTLLKIDVWGTSIDVSTVLRSADLGKLILIPFQNLAPYLYHISNLYEYSCFVSPVQVTFTSKELAALTNLHAHIIQQSDLNVVVDAIFTKA